MKKHIIDKMVGAFLGWRLPNDFSPDCHITFNRDRALDNPNLWPIGTNLFTGEQARLMFEHVIAEIELDNFIQVTARDAGYALVFYAHEASKRTGWWHDLETGAPIVERPHVVGEKLMLVVSEVSEAMEGHRKNLMDDKLPHRKMVEVELADAVIRIADLAGALGLDLGGAIAEKMEFNAQRDDHKIENRRGENGKKY
jgi:NTP pyrophosphatase (non-canonical NTP hydrolase)